MDKMEHRLVKYLAEIHYDDLPQNVVHYCKLLIIDSLGVSFAGAQSPGSIEATRVVNNWTLKDGSSILVHGNRVAPPLAALVNGTMMHSLDFDDTLDTSALHTFVSVFPAALSTGEARGKVNGKKLIEALVAGVEIVCRLGIACSRPLSWIRTSTCGAFGAAAAAGKILDLNYEQLKNALGIVYSQCSGNAQCLIEGKLVKRLQPGFASQAGVMAAFLAFSGITGPDEFLSGKYGFFPLYENSEYDEQSVVKDLNDSYAILSLSIKPYPCCRMTHASIDAALALREAIKDKIESVEKIEVMVPKMPAEMVGKPFELGTNPQVDAQFSIPYTVSVALIRGDVFLQDFEIESIRDEEVLRLASKVRVIEASNFPPKEMSFAMLKIKTTDGNELIKEVHAPVGSVGNPLTGEQCYSKFRKCIEYSGLLIDDDKLDNLIKTIDNLENVNDISVIPRYTIVEMI